MQASSKPQRGQRIAEQIQRDLAEMIRREVPAAVGLVTVSGVELTPDYAHAKVYFTVLGGDPAAAARTLNDKAGWFHSLLFKRLAIHTVPSLKFVHDTSVERGFEIDRLIADAVAPRNSGK